MPENDPMKLVSPEDVVGAVSRLADMLVSPLRSISVKLSLLDQLTSSLAKTIRADLRPLDYPRPNAFEPDLAEADPAPVERWALRPAHGSDPIVNAVNQVANDIVAALDTIGGKLGVLDHMASSL